MRPAAVALVVAALVAAGAAVAAGMSIDVHASPPPPLRTALYLSPDDYTAGGQATTAIDRMAHAGVSFVRIAVSWQSIAPRRKPAQWTPDDPADTHYDFAQLDSDVQAVVARHLTPYLTLFDPPTWAQGAGADGQVAYRPSAAMFGQFAEAVARRYDGSFDGLPRVSYWQAWNEPNISLYLNPQIVNGKPVSPELYRRLLTSFAAAVRGVHSDNVVISAGLAPFRDITQPVVSQDKDWGPLSFMRDLLCVSATGVATCSTHVPFDVWAMHPYTSGSPLSHMTLPNEVSIGDLPKVQKLLGEAERLGHVSNERSVELWVTEFSWDSDPPDPGGVPIDLLTRWTSEALYRMWLAGVSVVTWFTLRDQPVSTSFFQSGLYFRGTTLATDKPKPILEAFRFPFVAVRSGASVRVWGRTPTSSGGQVVIEQEAGSAWRTLETLESTSAGMFDAVVATNIGTPLRARFVTTGESSQPYSLVEPPNHHYNPFGVPKLFPQAAAGG